MERIERFNPIIFMVICSIAVQLEAVTVNPSQCPTNKIAPHKRIVSYGMGRTFGAFYDLLAPGNPQRPYGPGNHQGSYRPDHHQGPYRPDHHQGPYRPGNHQGPYGPGNLQGPYDIYNDQNLNDLQEQPQEDDPSDCGEIEDYDENDLSAITPQGNRRQSPRDSRDFFGTLSGSQQNYPQRPPPNFGPPTDYPQRPHYPERPPNYPQRPPNYPQRPPNYPVTPTERPQRPTYIPTRPPYWSGGFFGSNNYRPPQQEYPSDNIKPAHEDSEENQVTYRPSVVGGSLGHVVGVSPIRPTSQDEQTTMSFYNRLRPSTPPNRYTTRRPRPRNLNNSSIFGSFVDLLFK